MFKCHEYSNEILYDEVDEGNEKRVVETAAHIIRQDIRVMLYFSYTYPEPKSSTFTASE